MKKAVEGSRQLHEYLFLARKQALTAPTPALLELVEELEEAVSQPGGQRPITGPIIQGAILQHLQRQFKQLVSRVRPQKENLQDQLKQQLVQDCRRAQDNIRLETGSQQAPGFRLLCAEEVRRELALLSREYLALKKRFTQHEHY